jgi:hypothetical protein
MPQQIVRTVDVVECLDDRILTTSDHPDLDVVAGETYDSVLDKLETVVCSREEKAAISHTLTSPEMANPVVLKNDIATYYPIDDLGELKDAVASVGDLPLTGNTLNDLRPVLDINAIYRWDGSLWVPFVTTGTIDHTQLASLNGDTNYLHMSLSELSSSLSQSHTHANQTILDAILSLGSGIIIKVEERLRIPTTDEKAALEGSVYVPLTPPSASNRYVTSVDPRLNTVKNPYVTFGLYGTGATFSAARPTRADITDLEIALAALATGGSIDFIQALEVLPAFYDFNGGVNWQGIVWDDPKALLMEDMASRQSIFKMAPQPSGSTAFWISTGAGQVHVRGITFQLGAIDTLGALIERDNTIFEDCTFTGIGSGAKGIKIDANKVQLRRCIFGGTLIQGVEILGDNCVIESCLFSVALPSYPALIVAGSNCQVTSSTVSQGQIQIQATASDALFDKIRMTSNTTFVDAGVNTRWLGGIPQDYQQAYIGRTRTVGPVNSHADFRGTTHTPFAAALSNPYTTEIEVLEGTYAFSSSVTISDGKSVKPVRRGAVVVNGATIFVMGNSTKVEGLIISATGASALTATGVVDVTIKDCELTMNGPDVVTNYAVNAASVSDLKVTGCQLSGTRGIKLVGDLRSKITHNTFSSTIYSTVADVTTEDLYYADNGEEGSVCLLAGVRGIIRGNQFLGPLPTKLGTVNSLWIGNYPPEANNTNGIDTISRSLGDLIQPIESTGAARSSFLGTASIAFLETNTPTAVTLPFEIGARIDRTQGYTVNLTWTASVFSGSALWEVTTVFRECSGAMSDLGTPNVKTALSPRTYLTVKQEESCSITFTSADYGYGSGINPTHVAIMVRRLGDDITDNLAGIAYLTEASITLARD